jgi:hypothetical protein
MNTVELKATSSGAKFRNDASHQEVGADVGINVDGVGVLGVGLVGSKEGIGVGVDVGDGVLGWKEGMRVGAREYDALMARILYPPALVKLPSLKPSISLFTSVDPSCVSPAISISMTTLPATKFALMELVLVSRNWATSTTMLNRSISDKSLKAASITTKTDALLPRLGAYVGLAEGCKVGALE